MASYRMVLLFLTGKTKQLPPGFVCGGLKTTRFPYFTALLHFIINVVGVLQYEDHLAIG